MPRTLTDTYVRLTNPYKPTKTDDCNYTVAVQLRIRQREEATRRSKHTHTWTRSMGNAFASAAAVITTQREGNG